MAKEQFKSNEAEDILMEAARRQAQSVGSGDAISRDRLHDMAAELDISPETLEQVLAEREITAREAELRAAFIQERRSKIAPAVTKFVTLNLMMVGIWAIISHGSKFPWFLFVLLASGFDLIRRIASALPTSGSRFETEFAVYKKEYDQRQRSRERRAARREEKNAAKRAAERAEQELDADPGDVISTRSYNTDSDDEVLRVGRGR